MDRKEMARKNRCLEPENGIEPNKSVEERFSDLEIRMNSLQSNGGMCLG
jgi:hypothetical protein